ncbi:MAG: DegV family protein [Anaerolineales bacterium]|jgi:DegV family protein with EDD domain
MPKLKILTDSTCDLPARYYDQFGIGVVPVPIRFGDAQFFDRVSIDLKGLFEKVAQLGILPMTSQPSVAQFAEIYRHWAREGYDRILSIHVTGALSGTLNSARLAAKEVAQETEVIPFDSLSGSAAMGYMCVEAAKMAKEGFELNEILTRLEEARKRVRVFLTLATLRYAQMSGRVGNLQSLIASVLNIQPIISLHEGTLSAGARVRTRQAALDRLFQLTREEAGKAAVNIAVIHAQAQDEAEQILARARESLHCVDSFVGEISATVAVHFGPKVIGTVVYPCAVDAEVQR